MAERTLQWGGRRCVYCSVSTLRRLTHADVLALNRRALFPKGNLQWRTTVLTHYYGPIEYLHVPLFCSGCQTLYFHNFVVPGPLLHNEVRMELAGDPSQYLCLQTGFSEVAFGIDLVRYNESLRRQAMVCPTLASCVGMPHSGKLCSGALIGQSIISLVLTSCLLSSISWRCLAPLLACLTLRSCV